jgi:hypothetical protein
MTSILGPVAQTYHWQEDYEPSLEDCVKATAERKGVSEVEIFYDWLSASKDGSGALLSSPCSSGGLLPPYATFGRLGILIAAGSLWLRERPRAMVINRLSVSVSGFRVFPVSSIQR